MRKRERENPCEVCGHYHKYEEGEVCNICGHRVPAAFDRTIQQGSAFPSEILKDFLYLGSYDNASRGEILKALGITHILNTVPACQNLYKNSFTYHCLKDDKILQFDEAIQFLEQCEKDKARALVHCMLGKNRSPAIVIAYLMKSNGWRLVQSSQWVKERRPVVELSPAVYQQLVEYEHTIFGSSEAVTVQPVLASESIPSFGFGFPQSSNTPAAPTFNHPIASIFQRASLNPNSSDFIFGAEAKVELRMMESSAFGVLPQTGSEAPMDST
ncbi:protein-tyrosine-phosphatase IBR5-like [Curcuma longa]|uniref:protein-tyrosine-phosphatase IBR5-like n=1 Tax=Curcuma longa TaxID=136217 RepID=UPI003D9F8366